MVQFPTRRPRVTTSGLDLGNIDLYFGIILTKVLAPGHLYHPVLPMKVTDGTRAEAGEPKLVSAVHVS